MELALVTIFLFVLMLIYFKIADRYNIIDKPNHRSAHTEITLRGGGIIFPIAFLFFIVCHVIFDNYNFSLDISSAPNYWIFGLGLVFICAVSFIDDLIDLSSKIRLVVHFLSVTLLLYSINAFAILPIWAVPLCYIFIIGILNAYNFMDGINGMSGVYSFVVLGSLLYVNQYSINFVEINFIIYPIIASLVFLFFNFRKKAKCFLGDIGSMGIAFWIIALIGLLILKTGEYKWILLLVVYGVETILTIMERLKLKENIFDAHRRHLYQLFVNEKSKSHLVVSILYAAIQIVINIIVIGTNLNQWLTFGMIIIPSVIIYLYTKSSVKKGIVIKH